MATTTGKPAVPATVPALERRAPNPHRKPRSIAYYAPATGRLVYETPYGARYVELQGNPRASDVLSFLSGMHPAEVPRVVFLCGATPDPAWFHEPVYAGWALNRWYNSADKRTGVYVRDGMTIDLRMVTPWFGDTAAAADPDACMTARRLLLRTLRTGFGDDVDLMNTPSMTGDELLEASMPYGLQVAPLPPALREEIQAFTTQGRRELYAPPHGVSMVASATLIDAVWQYAACLSHLPTGRVQRDYLDVYAGYTPGFYRVRARVPRGWDKAGLLPLRMEDGAIEYPRHGGQSFDAWVTSAELDAALNPKWGHTWEISIRERIVWPDTGRGPDPLKHWLLNLRAARATLLKINTAPSQLAAGAVRHILIDTIGRWYATARDEWGIVPLSQIGTLPRGAVPHILDNPDGREPLVSYMRPAQIRADLLRFAQPQWSATAWGRSRQRTAVMVCRLPLRSLMRVHTDGVWTCATETELEALGLPIDMGTEPTNLAPGTWRIKSFLPGPLTWPTTEAEYWTLGER